MAKKIFRGVKKMFGGGKKKTAAPTAAADGPQTRALTADEAAKFDPRKRKTATPQPRLGGMMTLLSDRLGA